MNKLIKELALDAGLLNYVDNETPREYFIHGHADLEEVQKFAELIVQESCYKLMEMHENVNGDHNYYHHASVQLKRHFGIE